MPESECREGPRGDRGEAVLPWQRPRSPYWHAQLLASNPLFLDAARVRPPKPCLQRNVLALACSISETQHYRTRPLLTLIPINLTLPQRLNDLPRRQIGLDGLAFLGFTQQNFRATKGGSHGVDLTYLDRFYARKCPGNAQARWKEFQTILTFARCACETGELEPSFASCLKHWQTIVHMVDSFPPSPIPPVAPRPPCRRNLPPLTVSPLHLLRAPISSPSHSLDFSGLASSP